MDKKVEILIAIDARLKGLEETIGGLKQANAETAGLGTSLAKMAGAAAGAFAGFGLGKFIADGVRFNATLESAALGIAAVTKQANPEKFKTFDAALAASASTIELLKQKAAESPATFEQLVQGLQGISGAASSANIPLKKQVDLVVMMSQALSGLGIRSEQILQESRALLTGNITEDAMAAKMLGITSEGIAKAKEGGQLFEFLSGKMAAFAEAGKRGQNTFSTAASNLEDALTQLKGKVAEPIFAALSAEILKITVSLNNPATAASMAGFGQAVGSVVQVLVSMLRGLVDHAGALKTIGTAALIAGTGVATFALGYKALQFAQWTAGWMASTKALALHTVALRTDAAAAVQAGAANAAAGAGGAATGLTGFLGKAAMPLVGIGIGASIYASRKAAAELEEAQAAALARAIEQRGNAETRSFLTLLAQVKAAKELTAQTEVRKEIEEKLKVLQEEANAETGLMKESLEISAGALQMLLTRWKELAGTAKEVVLTNKEQAEQAALLDRTLGAMLRGQTDLVDRAADEKRVLELVNGALKEGVKSRAQAEALARQIVAAERESLGIAQARKLQDTSAEISDIGSPLAQRIRSKEAHLRTLKSRRLEDDTRAGVKPRQHEPELPGAFDGPNLETGETGSVLPPLPDDSDPEFMARVAGREASPQQKQSQADTDKEIRREEAELAELRNQAAKERAESEKHITEFKDRQLTAEQNALDPLKETTTEVERQQAVRKKVAELTEANEAIQEGQKKTQAQILTLAQQEVANDELAAKLQREKSAGLQTDKKTLTALKKEYQEIARLIADIDSSRLIPSGQKAGLTGALKRKQRDNLVAQGAQGEDTGGEVANLDRDQQRQQQEGSFGGQFQGQFNSWADSLGTAGANAADMLTSTLGAAMDGLNDSIYGLITGTATWGDVWQQVGAGVLKEIIGITTKTILHYAIVTPLQTAFHSLGMAQQAAGTAATVTQAATKVAAETPAAVASSTTSWGASAVIGLAAVLAVLAAVGFSGGFAHGGYTGDGRKFDVAGTVHKGEFVFTKEATSRMGVDYLNSLQVAAHRGYATGGVVAGAQPVASAGGGGGRPIHIHNMSNEEESRRVLLDHPDAEHQFIKAARRGRHRIG